MPKTRAIRIPDNEEKIIKEFLKKNPFFDFSSLARTAISHFIRNPEIRFTPIKKQPDRGLV